MQLTVPLLICLAFAQPCLAQSDDRAARIVTAWSEWADAGGTSETTIAVMRGGEMVAETGIGVSADTAMPLASLSKAVTAACLAKLSQDGRLSMDATLRDFLDVPEPLQDTTLGEILTHTSGIWPDSTQGNTDLRQSDSKQIDAVSQQASDREPQMGEVGTFAYNNENYAVLGAVIQEVTSETYEDACTDAILAPLGIRSANMQGEWAAHGSWGGWSMSASDFARFAWATFGKDSDIGTSPQDWPTTDVGGGTNHGMGVLWRKMEDYHLFWSSGMLCWEGSGDGGYFASYGGEWLVVALYSDCLAGTERLAELDRALFEAAVK